MNVAHTPATALSARWSELRAEQPNVRIRNAAEQLGVSELELLATQVGVDVVRLDATPPEIIGRMHELGRVMALTRNDVCVHERSGTFEKVSFDGGVGLVLGPDIDLRIFASQWRHTFAVTTHERRGPRRSLQFFDAAGAAVHKVFLLPDSNHATFARWSVQYRSDDQSAAVAVEAPARPPIDRADTDVDVEGFRAAWRVMTDTHEFFGLTRRFGVGRQQALRLAPEGYARQVSTRALRDVLGTSAATGMSIMVFVNNPGCIQIHTGPVTKLVETGEWYNVLDPDFNLHVHEASLGSAWHVTKPTVDGEVNSLELFDKSGELVALLFGERKPGKPEVEAWRALAYRLR